MAALKHLHDSSLFYNAQTLVEKKSVISFSACIKVAVLIVSSWLTSQTNQRRVI